MKEFEAYLLLGANMGDRMAYLEKARVALGSYDIRVIDASRIYETEPFGKEDGPTWFLNQALKIRTDLPPQKLLLAAQKIERFLGREALQHSGPRTIDIDILLYSDEVIDLPDLRIPHPRIAERRFALVPLAEIAPGLKDPVSGQTFKKILSECKDRHKVVTFP